MAGMGTEISKVGMLGVGSMGAMMTLLMADKGYEVFYFDPSVKNMDQLEGHVRHLHLQNKVHRQSGYDQVCDSLTVSGKDGAKERKVFMFSTPHGEVVDGCIQALRTHLNSGDLIIDCSNEHWANTERRQRALAPDGIHLVGCGVSGGYQSARHGPSMAPSGSNEALELAVPFLRTLAARDRQGKPCTVPVGPAGSGHYVKMVHNGIEQGMMSVLAEAWMLLRHGVGYDSDTVAEIFQSWDAEGPLRDCFLIAIGADIEHTTDENGVRVLDTIRDKVVQDVNGEEGTGTWTAGEIIALHVSGPSIVTAHLFRCASASLARRSANQKHMHGVVEEPHALETFVPSVRQKEKFVEELRAAIYFCFLACFAQGLDLIRAKSRVEGWDLDMAQVLQLWRGGCIIQADHIINDLLAPMYKRLAATTVHKEDDDDGGDKDDGDGSTLGNAEIGDEMAKQYKHVKTVVAGALHSDFPIPSISQSLEYYKYETSTRLPTQFMEAQLDYFGQHMFDRKDDPIDGPQKGKHHFEWKPARGPSGG